MSLNISGNSIDGDLLVDAGIITKDVDLIFTNNLVKGDAHIRSDEVTRDICINACSYEKMPEENPMSPEVWFMYRNFFLDKRNIWQTIQRYALGQVEDLVFYLEPEDYSPILNEKIVCKICRCMDFLARYAI